MHNVMFDANVPMPAGFMQLARAWEVRAERAYQNRRPGGVPGSGWVLVRTLAGRGEMLLENRRMVLGANSLLLLEPRRVRHYGCLEAPWTFWWFECGTGSSWPFPAGVVLSAAAVADEARQLENCARSLREGPAPAPGASAKLLLLCHQWHTAGATTQQSDPGARRRIREAMQRMVATADRPLPLSTIAREAHLSEGYFRRLFSEVAGCSPKAYYENLRLARAVPWLQAGEMKLAEIADRLAYSSAFHFSRAFKKRYGRPPSSYFAALSEALEAS